MPRLDKIAHTVTHVPSRVDRLFGVDPPVSPVSPSESQPNPGLPRFITRLIIDITLRILRYVERRARPSATLQTTVGEGQGSSEQLPEDTTSNARPHQSPILVYKTFRLPWFRRRVFKCRPDQLFNRICWWIDDKVSYRARSLDHHMAPRPLYE